MLDPKTPVDPHLPAPGWAQIAQWLAAADIDLAEISASGWSVHLPRESGYQPQAGPAPAHATHTREMPGASSEHLACVTAPLAGFFHDCHPLRKQPMVRPGSAVRAGDIVGFLRVGVLLVPLVAPVHGVVVKTLALPGALVGYASPLIQLDTGEREWK